MHQLFLLVQDGHCLLIHNCKALTGFVAHKEIIFRQLI